MPETAIWNFQQLPHHELDGSGGIGEGMSGLQIAKDGRRILWLAHESAPKNFTAVDVSDPRAPKIVARADLPQSHMRSNSLETVGDIMAVAYRRHNRGSNPPGSNCSTSRCRKTRVRSRSSIVPGQIRAACISCGLPTASTSI